MTRAVQILLLRFGGIGDTLVVFPSVRLLRETFSGFSLQMICREDVGEIFILARVVDQVISPHEARVRELFRKRPSSEISGLFSPEDYFLIIGWFNKSNELNLTPGEFIIYDQRSLRPINQFFFIQTREVAEKYKRQQGVSYNNLVNLPVTHEWLTKARALLPGMLLESPFGLVCPGSGSREKCWPLELYLKLIEEAARRQLRGLLISGPAEDWLLSRIKNWRFPPGWFHLHHPPLWAIAGWMKMARFYVGNDSGLTHLAALCGVPGVALFLEKNLPVWTPGGKLLILSTPTLGQLSLLQVKKTLFSQLS